MVGSKIALLGVFVHIGAGVIACVGLAAYGFGWGNMLTRALCCVAVGIAGPLFGNWLLDLPLTVWHESALIGLFVGIMLAVWLEISTRVFKRILNRN